MFKQRLPLFAAALWWGSLTVIGFMVVPMLFANLETPAIAGRMAAKLFSAQTWVSLACGFLLLVMSRPRDPQETTPWPPIVMMALLAGMLLALLAEFAVAPRIVMRENLALWHSLGSGTYLLQWLCAAMVLWKLSAKEAPARG